MEPDHDAPRLRRSPAGETPGHARSDAAAHLAGLEAEVRAERLQEELLRRHAALRGPDAPPAARAATGAPAPPVSDRPELVGHLRAGLVPGEFLHAVLDLKGRGAGFVALTSRRVVVAGRAPWGKPAVTSLSYRHLTSVALPATADAFGRAGFAAGDGLVLGTAHGPLALEFRSAGMARLAHDLLLRYLL
jgi:hypothetical protein